MIKLNELRIGNYVNYLDGHVTLTSVTEEFPCINQITLDYLEYDEIEPIPLTEEWLKRLGFKKTKESKDVEWYSLNSFDISIHEEDNNVYIVFQHLVLKHITKVHQLQNLYFALTNEELTFKP